MMSKLLLLMLKMKSNKMSKPGMKSGQSPRRPGLGKVCKRKVCKTGSDEPANDSLTAQEHSKQGRKESFQAFLVESWRGKETLEVKRPREELALLSKR
jgi:hypothetical protein